MSAECEELNRKIATAIGEKQLLQGQVEDLAIELRTARLDAAQSVQAPIRNAQDWVAVGACLPTALNHDPEAVAMFNALQNKIAATHAAEKAAAGVATQAAAERTVSHGGACGCQRCGARCAAAYEPRLGAPPRPPPPSLGSLSPRRMGAP